MSRTFRNRHGIPKGWCVRDDGYPYLNGSDQYGREALSRGALFMQGIPRYRRKIYRCEQGWARLIWRRVYRKSTNQMVRMGLWEKVLPPKRTSGWDSW